MTTVELESPITKTHLSPIDPKNENSEQQDAPKKIPKRKPRNPVVKALLMAIRRSHLYFGLLLAPWALLYGITAYLFNHPTHFSTNVIQTIPGSMLPTDLAVRDWEAQSRAQQIVESLRERFPEAGQDLQLTLDFKPRWDATTVTGMVDAEGKTYSVTLPMNDGSGTFRVFPQRAEPAASKSAFFSVAPGGGGAGRGRSGQRSGSETPAITDAGIKSPGSTASSTTADVPPNRRPLKLSTDVNLQLQNQLGDLLHRLDPSLEFDSEQIRITALPVLAFQIDNQDQQWECKHDELAGSVSTQSVSDKQVAEFSWRRFFLRLHTAHGYPADGVMGARWFWAILVDVMAFVMVFWGVSGIIMWWQIKSTRRWGTVAMITSLLAAAWLGFGMYHAIRV